MITARIEKRPFKIAFGGYSVTVGRGNYFDQSYPFVMERILKDPMKMLGIDLDVRNAAIGGIPSFPYGWCLKNFLGSGAYCCVFLVSSMLRAVVVNQVQRHAYFDCFI